MLSKELSLAELVEYRKRMEIELKEGEVLPDEVVEMAEVANQLLSGKIDQAGRFRDGLIGHIVAVESQLKNLKGMLELTESLMKKAVEASGGKRLDGSAYSLRVQTNGGSPSTIIDDETKIPIGLKKVTFSQSFLYKDDDLLYWVRALLGRMVGWKKDLVEKEQEASPFYRLDVADNEREKLERHFTLEISKSAIGEVIKGNGQVPGAHQERGTHLRVVPGQAKSKELPHG